LFWRDEDHIDPQLVEPALGAALDSLSRKQRVAVVLVHAYEWTHAEAAQVMGIKEPTVKTHVQRGLVKLRRSLGVTLDA
jgi:RNA polymerase sigma-70 factor (ECF subfamily)